MVRVAGDPRPGVAGPDQHRTYDPHGGARELFDCQDRVVVYCGPAGTGKTRADLEKAYAVANKHAGSRQLFAMAEKVLLSRSTLVTFEELVVPRGHPVLKGPGRLNRMEYQFANGSVIACGGMHEADRVMGTEWDRIYLFEATQCIEEDAQRLITRLRWGKAGFHQIVIECNPDHPGHWIKGWIDEGRCTHIESRHQDNPRWYTPGVGWTPEGRDYVLGSLAGRHGVERERLYLGRWVASEGGVFNGDVLAAHRATYGRDPFECGTLILDGEGTTLELGLARRELGVVKWQPEPEDAPAATPAPSPWRLWTELVPDRYGRLRPPQDADYVIAADVSHGMGASQSTMTVIDVDRRAKIAEFADGTIEPGDFARMLVAAGIWFGGRHGCAMLGWETNGPGESVSRHVVGRLSYPRVYRDISRTRGVAETTERVGWTSNQGAKIRLAETLADAYGRGLWVNPSKRSIDQAFGWIRYENGGIGPARLEREGSTARATHGDLVISDMLGVHILDHVPLARMREIVPPEGSPAWHDREDAKRRRAETEIDLPQTREGW